MKKNTAAAISMMLLVTCVMVGGVFIYPNQRAARRNAVASGGQMPFATVLACSDSRAPVELIFERGIGEIFVIRVAGNMAMNSDVVGSAEYAVEHLGIPLLVILGHTGWGAVKAAIRGLCARLRSLWLG